MSNHAMVSASQFDPDQLTWQDLAAQYGTGRTESIIGTGRGRSVLYRNGIQTEIGDFEAHDWMRLVRSLICRSGEEDLQQQLLNWVYKNMPWLHSDFERQLQALELHASRIFENPQWVGYEKFREEYLSKPAETTTACDDAAHLSAQQRP